MSISIVIAGTVIEVPNTSDNPNWGPSMVTFFKAVESAFASAIGPYDIPPQIMNIDGTTYNPTATPQNITNLSFSTSTVRAAFVEYSVFRTGDTPTETAYEAGNIIAVYNTTAGTWDVTQDKVGDGRIAITVDATGQFQFTTTAVGTTNHLGKISFKATALTNS